jgi:hypothetical protein
LDLKSRFEIAARTPGTSNPRHSAAVYFGVAGGYLKVGAARRSAFDPARRPGHNKAR